MSEPRLPSIEFTSPSMSLTTPLLSRVLVGNDREGEGVMMGCCCTTAAGFGRLPWTTDDEARGRSARRTEGRLVRCMITSAGGGEKRQM